MKPSFTKLTIVILLILSNNFGVFAQNDTLSILHITDLHLILNQSAYIPEMMEYRKKKQYNEGEIRFRNFLETVPDKTGSDLVVATGDLVDFFESTIEDGSTLDSQPAQFAKLLEGYQVPILFTLGNHDVFSFDWDEDLDYKLLHNQNNVEYARSLWMKNVSSFDDGTYYSKVMTIGNTDYRLIFIDNSFYQFTSEDKTAQVPYLSKPQLYWLKNQFDQSENDYEILFMHIPFSSKKNKNQGNEFYALVSENSTVKLILSGHHHKNIIKDISPLESRKIMQVQTGALVKDADNWRRIELTEKNIIVSQPGEKQSELIIPLE